MRTHHYYIICKNLPQLRFITLQTRSALKPALVSDIIRHADNLEFLSLSMASRKREKPTIDSSQFKEWVEIVTNRCNNTPLEIRLCGDSYTTKHAKPVEASKGKFTLVISDGLDSFGNMKNNIIEIF